MTTEYLEVPTFGQVRNHLKAGGTVEQFWHSDQRWHLLLRTGQTARAWERFFNSEVAAHELVQPQHGLRLVLPIPPKTERVKLHRVIGRRLACRPEKIAYAVQVTGPYPTVEVSNNGQATAHPNATTDELRDHWLSREKVSLVLGNDGEVEVLVEEPCGRFSTCDPSEQRLPRENTVATQSYVDQQLHAHIAEHHRLAEALAGDLVDAQAEVLRRAKAYSRAARTGAGVSTLRARKEELIRAAARLGA